MPAADLADGRRLRRRAAGADVFRAFVSAGGVARVLVLASDDKDNVHYIYVRLPDRSENPASDKLQESGSFNHVFRVFLMIHLLVQY